MKRIFLTFIAINILSNVYSQTNNIFGEFMGREGYLKIEGNYFRLSATNPHFLGLSANDLILAEGEVEYVSNNFLKLTTKNYSVIADKTTSIIETAMQLTSTDSICFIFNFPFSGDFEITIIINGSYENSFSFYNKKIIKVPFNADNLVKFSFSILNKTPNKGTDRNYLKQIVFNSFDYKVIHTDINTFNIFIPDLSNSYFYRYLINGEYLFVRDDKQLILWRNEKYIPR